MPERYPRFRRKALDLVASGRRIARDRFGRAVAPARLPRAEASESGYRDWRGRAPREYAPS